MADFNKMLLISQAEKHIDGMYLTLLTFILFSCHSVIDVSHCEMVLLKKPVWVTKLQLDKIMLYMKDSPRPDAQL